MGGLVKMATGLLGSLFGEDEPTPPPAPPVEKVPVMPLPDDKAVADAKKRSIAQQMARRSSRANTILTDPVTGGGSDALGG